MNNFLPIISPSDDNALEDATQLVNASLVSVDSPHQILPHQHECGQLVYASHGSLQVTSMGNNFAVPTLFAAWFPPEVVHSVTATTPIDYCSLFIDASICDGLPAFTQLLHLTPLLKELTRAAARKHSRSIPGVQSRLGAVILDQLQLLKPACIALPIPATPRMKTLVEHYMVNPGEKMDLEYWTNSLGMSERSLTRNFKKETGLSIGQWLQHLKVLKAIEHLEAGETVKSVAFDLGYHQPSAFISMFKGITGQTPSNYIPDIMA